MLKQCWFGVSGVLLAIGLSCLSFAALAEVITRPVGEVSRIEFRLPGELQVRYGMQEKLVVDAPANVIPKLDISVKGDALVLTSNGSFKSDRDLKIVVTLKSLRAVHSAGSGKVEITGFSGNAIDIDAAGSGDVSLKNVSPVRLAIAITGSGNVNAAGSGKTLLARIGGSGTIDAADYRVRMAEADISGSGDIRLHAEESLKAGISGAGSILYRGKAKLTQSVTGAGSVDKF